MPIVEKNRINRSIKENLPLVGAVGVAVAVPLYDLLLSDLTFIRNYSLSPLLEALFVPMVYWVALSLALFGIYSAVRFLSPNVARIMFSCVIAFFLTLFSIRSFYLLYGVKVESSLYLAITYVFTFGVTFFYNDMIRRVLSLFAAFSLFYSCFFVYSAFTEYNENPFQKGEVSVIDEVSVLDAAKLQNRAIMIILDELSLQLLRNGSNQIDKLLFPNLAKLAQSSTYYINHTTGESSTVINLKAMTSGIDLFTKFSSFTAPKKVPMIQNALHNHTRVYVDEPRGVIRYHENLKKNSLTSFWVHNQRLLYVYMFGVLPDWLVGDATLDSVNEIGTSKTITYPDRFSLLTNEIKNHKSGLYIFYSFLPHHSYRRSPDGSLISPHNLNRSFNARDKAENTESYINVHRSYINQVKYVDNLIGQFIRDLKSENLYDDSLLIITSDHGVGYTFQSPGRDNSLKRDKVAFTDSNMMNGNTLLLVKYPHQKVSKKSAFFSRPQDLGITIAEHMGIEPKWPHEGISLFNGDKQKDSSKRALFRPTEYEKKIYLEPVILPEPSSYIIKQPKVEPVRTSFLGQRVSYEMVKSVKGGALLSFALECSLPTENSETGFVLTFDGFSFVNDIEKIGDLVYLSLNNILVKATPPSQYYVVTRSASEKGLVHTKWTMQIPFQHLKDGKNAIEAYSYLDGGEDSGFHRFTNRFELEWDENASRLKGLEYPDCENRISAFKKIFSKLLPTF